MSSSRTATGRQVMSDGNAQGNFSTDADDLSQEWRRLIAELVGTFALTFVAAGGPVIAAATGVYVGRTAFVTAPGLLVLAMIYTVGDVSGAHFNPAVTLAFATRRDFPWSRVPGYWVAQVVGAIAAAGVLRAMFGTPGHLGATLPKSGDVRSVVMEAMLTCLLVTVILGTAEGHKLVGHNAAIASGSYIIFGGAVRQPRERRLDEPGPLSRSRCRRGHHGDLLGLHRRSRARRPACSRPRVLPTRQIQQLRAPSCAGISRGRGCQTAHLRRPARPRASGHNWPSS